MSTRNLPGSEAARHGTGDADLTIMLGAHAAFRRDLVRLARAAAFADLPDPARRASVQAGWEVFKRRPGAGRRGSAHAAAPGAAGLPRDLAAALPAHLALVTRPAAQPPALEVIAGSGHSPRISCMAACSAGSFCSVGSSSSSTDSSSSSCAAACG
jgi:hypothetical protein